MAFLTCLPQPVEHVPLPGGDAGTGHGSRRQSLRRHLRRQHRERQQLALRVGREREGKWRG